MKTKNIFSILSMAVLTALAVSRANAQVIATVATGTNNAFTVSTTDLADASQGGSVSFTGTENYGSSAAKVIDGDVYGQLLYSQTENTLTPSVGNTLTLNLAPSVQGWDISSIVVLTGAIPYQAGRSDHSYTIALSTDGTTFGAPIINVNNTTTSTEVRMTIADNSSIPLGTGIKAVRFVFGNATSFPENMYREIDVLPVASVPEPALFRISSLSRVVGDVWELTLEASPSTLYEFRSSADLSFSPGTLIESLTQGNPGTDPGTISGANNEFITTDGGGNATVRVTITGTTNFIRAQDAGM